MKPRFVKLSYFFWLIVPVILWLTYQAFGLPHAIWSYAWIDEGQGQDVFAHRTYTSCLFIGPYGEFERPAVNGKCGWVRFFKKEAR